MTKKKTINVKDHLEDDTLDLSLCGLQEVPVKEIAANKAIIKATTVDISSNQLTSLGNNFAKTFSHIVKLDLSNNQLRLLPEDFGLLVNLKHLDLYKNKLESLPASFADLRSLRWLDLKENPLIPVMARVAGTCLNQAECKAAAVNVVKFFICVQKELEEKRAKEAAERLERLKEEEQKALKKEEKKKRQKMKKNAAKLEEMALLESARNGGAVVEEVELLQPKLAAMDDAAGRFSFVGKAGSIMLWLVKFAIASVLLSFLFLSLVSVLDDATYKKCLLFLGIKWDFAPLLHSVLLVLKSNGALLINLVYTICSDYVPFLVRLSYGTAVEWWESLSAGNAVIYMDSLSGYLYVTYLRALELCSTGFQKVASSVQGYFN